MRLVKIEKTDCPACDMVSAFLDNEEVNYDKWNIEEVEGNGQKAREILGSLGLFTVPVTVVLEGDELKAHSRGFNPGELAQLVEQVK